MSISGFSFPLTAMVHQAFEAELLYINDLVPTALRMRNQHPFLEKPYEVLFNLSVIV